MVDWSELHFGLPTKFNQNQTCTVVFCDYSGNSMANNIQFSIAVHLLAGLAYKGSEGATSGDLAKSVNTSPRFVRRTLASFSKGVLVETTAGKAGACWLAKDEKDISLVDVYEALDAPKSFAIH